MENLTGTRTNPYRGVRVRTTDDAAGGLGTHLTEGSVDPAARRLDFYRLAAECAVDGWLQGFAESALIAERDGSPPGDPSRAWTDEDLEKIVKRVYATHRRTTTVEDDPAVAS